MLVDRQPHPLVHTDAATAPRVSAHPAIVFDEWLGSRDETVLISEPPYHIAGMANVLSNLFAGRRIVYLPHFDPRRWLELVETERITHAMVVPTMLSRIVDAIDGSQFDVSTLRSLSYGGAKVSERVVRAASCSCSKKPSAARQRLTGTLRFRRPISPGCGCHRPSRAR
jgi:acyl-CoA synthetase (AMP-forming)/AMP-acid ligase II